MQTNQVVVRASARLHLGFLDLHGGLGRRFGGLGMAIDGLDAIARAWFGPPAAAGEDPRAAAVLARLRDGLRLDPEAQVQLESSAPGHAGLGSGTQTGLALATALVRLHGGTIEPRRLAAMLGRGARSGIGLATFEQGGFIVDGGHGETSDSPPPLLARYAFPSAWRIVLLLDQRRIGLHGGAEREAFARLPPMAETEAAQLARWCLLGLMPALLEERFEPFVAAIDEIQQRVGAHFAPAQGGQMFTSPDVATVVAHLRTQLGVRGTGQSSWGPTGFVFASCPDHAEEIMRCLARLDLPAVVGRILTGCNHGAIVEATS